VKNKKHPYEWRLLIRQKLSWFLIDLGFAAKGKNCEIVGANHDWYNKGNNFSACYYCKIEKEGELWKTDKE
jgi:hypothetical protein